MPSAPVAIPPRRSLAFFATLALGMVALSYVLVLSLAAACVYLPWLLITNDTNFTTLALLIAGLIVAASLLWSLVPRPDNFVPPGPLLERDAHPRLFAELDSIAAGLGESLPREVYLIGDPNAWVADRGGTMGFGSRRLMGLGLPLLFALNVSQFRAVLAHEFAHYYGGDTSLGPWLYRTKVAMIRTFQNMGSVGRVMRVAVMQVLYVVVFGILKWYWKLFLRAINFVSRRQEFRADELACIVAGPEALTSGLRIIHGAVLAWPAYWRSEVIPMLDSGLLPSIGEGFSQFLNAPGVARQLQAGIEAELREGKIEPYDSHPPLRDRIAAAEKLPQHSHLGSTEPASTLVDNEAVIELAFLQALNPEMKKEEMKHVPWSQQAEAVVIPSWTAFVSEYAPLLQGITVGNLFEYLGRIPEVAPQIRDPKGMLLAPEQRVERARSLFGTALGLALVNHGWKLHSSPGEFHLERSGERMNPFEIILQLSDGSTSKETWKAKCREFGIDDVPLVELQKAATATTQESLPFG